MKTDLTHIANDMDGGFQSRQRVGISPILLRQCWEQASERISDLDPSKRYSLPALIDLINNPTLQLGRRLTKSRVETLHKLHILQPEKIGIGTIRSSWRFSAEDVQRILWIDLLRSKTSLSFKDIYSNVKHFDPLKRDDLAAWYTNTDDDRHTLHPPKPKTSTRTLLWNRALGTLVTVLINQRDHILPNECLIAIQPVHQTQTASAATGLGWQDVESALSDPHSNWYIGVASEQARMYVYLDFKEIMASHSHRSNIRHYEWASVGLRSGPQPGPARFYQCLIGLPYEERRAALGSRTLQEQLGVGGTPVALERFPGLSTLLQVAFMQDEIDVVPGATQLSALAEFIASASDFWEYCAVLVPDRSGDQAVISLRVRAHSTGFPIILRDKVVAVGQFLSGWSYSYNQHIVVEHVADDDPRIAHFSDERPTAAAAIPAVASPRSSVIGVLYVGTRKQLNGDISPFSDELVAFLRICGHICGDMIARESIQLDTVRHISQFSLSGATGSSYEDLGTLDAFVARIAELIVQGAVSDATSTSWLYLLVLNMSLPTPHVGDDSIADWLTQQALELTGKHLSRSLWEFARLKVCMCQIDARVGQYVFAIESLLPLHEETFKEKIQNLQENLDGFAIGRVVGRPMLYTWGIMLKYEMLKKVLRDIGMADVKTDIGRAIRVNALIAPYLNRGHQALRARDLDTALYEFERATIIAKNHWYPYKHVAEVRLLKGSDEDLSGAIANCKEAIRLNPGYASAHCLLADCLFLKGKFQDAIIHFESALRIAPERADFHARYAIALSTMSDADFSQAIQNLLHKPEKFAYSLKDKTPLALALDHLDRAHEYSVAQAISTHRPQLQDAEYFFGRGVAFLQAYLLAPEASKDAKDLKSKAQEQFKLARRYDANSHHILHGYGMAHGIRRNL